MSAEREGGGEPSSGTRVWIVWSDRSERSLIRAQCREEGFDTAAVESLRHALALLARGSAPPRIIVLDATNAARDLDAWRSLRQALGETRVIAVTGPTREDRVPGVNRTLVRPLEIAELIRALRELSSP